MGVGRAKLRLSRGYPRRTRLRRHPSMNQPFASIHQLRDIGSVAYPDTGWKTANPTGARRLVLAAHDGFPATNETKRWL
jgi:hypothetical protein